MRILLIHNQYKFQGGEDSVFRSESELLQKHGHVVDQLVYSNTVIKTFLDKCFTGLKTIYNPDSANDLKIRIEEFTPDIIHIHNFLPLVSPSVLFIAKKFGIPVILTLHNYRLICPSATLFRNGQIYEKSIHTIFPFDAIWKGVYRNSRLQTAAVALVTAVHHLLGTWKHKVDYYITLTKFSKDKFEHSALGIPSGKFLVKPNFVTDHGVGDPLREDFFLFVGRLVEEKGIRTLVKAAALFDFDLVFIGDGPLREFVESSALVNPRISVLGQQTPAAVLTYLKKCKALIFPSTWYEGFGNTIIEAFSTGTPVIASNLGGTHEIVKNRSNGLLFRPGDEYDLVEKIVAMKEESGLASRLSMNARASYLQFYTPAKNYDQLVGIYDNVLEERVRAKFSAESLVHSI